MSENTTPPDISTAVEAIHGIGVYVVWGRLGQQRKEELVNFWLKHKAIPNVQEATRRTQEVVCMALDEDDRIAGVSTVYIAPYGPEKLPYWYYRTFVRPDCRLPGLTVRFFRASLRCLKEIAASQPGLSHGLVVMTENRRLKHPGWHKKLTREGMRYVTVTPDGMDVWKHDF